MKVNSLENGISRINQMRYQEAINPDRRFQQGVGSQRIVPTINPFAAKITAESQSSHESSKNSGDGIMRVAHHQSKEPGPDHLVYEAGSSGNEKEQEHPGSGMGIQGGQ